MTEIKGGNSVKEYVVKMLGQKRGARWIAEKLKYNLGIYDLEGALEFVRKVQNDLKYEKKYSCGSKNECACKDKDGGLAGCGCHSASKRNVMEEESEEDCEKRLQAESNLAFVKKELDIAKKEISILKKNLGSKNADLDRFLEDAKAVTPLPFKIKPFKKGSKSVSAVILFSDWHLAEKIKKEDMEGHFNEFSYEIGKQRVMLYIQKFISWAQLHQHNYNIDEVVILCTGDLISGSIHEEILVGSDFYAPKQAFLAGELLADAVSTLAPLFKKIRIEFVVLDNHGRLSLKRQHKGGGENTHNYTVGMVAKSALRNHTNVEFNFYPCAKKVIKVQNRKYLIEHGCSINSVMGIPFYGIDRYIGRECQARKGTDLQFDLLVIGHFHQPIITSRYIMSGSLVGDSEFGRSFGGHEWACQMAWLVHEDHGEFSYINFWLNGPNA